MERQAYGVGYLIRQRRELLEVSQLELAERTGIPQRTISRIENTTEDGYLPQSRLLIPLARELGLRMADLVAAAGYPVETAAEMEADDAERGIRVFTMAMDETDSLDFPEEEKIVIRSTIRLALRELQKRRD